METPSALAFRLLCAGLILADLCESSSFRPNCTLPTDSTNYVSGPNTRSTIAIFWNCTTVMILCTWSIQHLNVPPISQPTSYKRLWIHPTVITKVRWMILTILAPEYLMAKALADYAAAHYSNAEMKLEGVENWGMIHCYLANMGHFVLDTQPPPTNFSGRDEINMLSAKSPLYRPPHETLINEILESEPSPASATAPITDSMPPSMRNNTLRLKHRYWALNCQQWAYLFKDGFADAPSIPSAHLKKLDKGGLLVKLLAILQAGYLVVQLISRKIQGLPSSQLEIGTLALSVSSIITYLLYIGHPQGVEAIHIIPMKSGGMHKIDIYKVVKSGPRYLWHFCRGGTNFIPDLGPSPIPNDGKHNISSLSQFNRDFVLFTLAACFGGLPFGGLHCLAWNSHFPTTAEAVAWKICSLIMTCLPLVITISFLVMNAITKYFDEKDRSRPDEDPSSVERSGSTTTRTKNSYRLKRAWCLLVFCGLILIFLYMVARFFILFEMIRSLFFLPPEAFIDTWSNAFPHWG